MIGLPGIFLVAMRLAADFLVGAFLTGVAAGEVAVAAVARRCSLAAWVSRSFSISRMSNRGLASFDKDLVGIQVPEVVFGVGGEEGDRGVVGGVTRSLNDFAAGGVGLHAHVGDHHLVFAELDFGLALAGAGGGVYIEAADFEHGFHGEQNGDFVVNEQNAALGQWEIS